MLLASSSYVSAQYRIVLKNGREIQVEDYREEAGRIRASLLSGEIALEKKSLARIDKIAEDPLFAPLTREPSSSTEKVDQPEETKKKIIELDAAIRKAEQEVRQGRQAGLGPEEIKDKQFQWNRLRLERFRYSRKLNLEKKEEAIPPTAPKP
jgi:hypothetical protein